MDEILLSHEYFMRMALKEAELAFQEDEVPVGAVVVIDNQVIAKTHNQCERLLDSTAHAEMLAITAASADLRSKYLEKCSLYVTLEPCVMCAGAIAHSRIANLIYGTKDPKKGYSLIGERILHPSTKVLSGIEETQCSRILSDFFLRKR